MLFGEFSQILFAVIEMYNIVDLFKLQRHIKRRINVYSSYFDIFYFFEILYLMIALLFVYGKLVSIAITLFLSLLLSAQIIMIYLRLRTSRIIQLFLMDFHIAITGAGVIKFFSIESQEIYTSSWIILIRIVIILFECLLIYFLTDDEVIAQFP